MAEVTANHPEWNRTCVATTKGGSPCRKFAIRGGLVCTSHGGAAPQVKAAAAERLDEMRVTILRLVPAAIETLSALLDSKNETVRLKAAERILDQAGLVVVTKQDVNLHKEEDDVSDLDAEITALLVTKGVMASDGAADEA